jgi:hypothetical protein
VETFRHQPSLNGKGKNDFKARYQLFNNYIDIRCLAGAV